MRGESDVAHLMAGRPIDWTGKVRYGVVGTPVKDSEAVAASEMPRSEPGPGRGGMPRAVHAKLQRLHASLRELLQQGRQREAEMALEAALRAFERAKKGKKRER